jgi:sugar phosphate isomerase/epimerase
MTITRREFGALALGTVAAQALAHAQMVSGVRIGVQTYSFRDLPRTPGGDQTASIIGAMNACGLTECELWSPMIEPPSPAASASQAGTPDEQRAARVAARDALRAWRISTPLTHFAGVKETFAKAGLSIYGYNYSFGNDFTDEEIDAGFRHATALGAEIITASTNLTVARRVVPFADRHRLAVAMHNHSNTSDPNEFATPESFAGALQLSPYFKINLDIGHFTAANYDPVAYLKEHHADITNLHIKDRKKAQGANTPWGEGDTPINEVMALLKQERWPIRAYVEYEYRDEAGPVEAVKKCAAYMKAALA